LPSSKWMFFVRRFTRSIFALPYVQINQMVAIHSMTLGDVDILRGIGEGVHAILG